MPASLKCSNNQSSSIGERICCSRFRQRRNRVSASPTTINYDPWHGVNAPVYDAEGTPLAGANYLAELWGGVSTNSLAPLLDINRGYSRLILPFNDRGHVNSASAWLSVLDVPPGGWAWLQMRAWDARIGPTYEEVVALGWGGYGQSMPFYAQGGDPTVPPPVPPGDLIGLQSFSLLPVVPEPSTWALLACVGLGRFCFARRHR
jgi:hypothetical protein